jgi:TRAP transporter TAXI family solute receptor
MSCNTCKVWIPILVIILLGIILAYQFVEPAPPKEVRIATGREGGGYHTFALKYKERLAKEKFVMEIQPTAGSLEVLQLLKAGKVSVGLVQGGTKNTESSEGLQSLASLFFEPLWIFHRKEQSLEYIFDLRGKRVAIGEDGSGTQALALQLLKANEIIQDNTSFLKFSSRTAAEKLISGEIEAAFFVTSPKSQIVSKLLHHPDIELLSFKRNTAYERLYPFLTSVKIGEGMINLEKNVPSEDKILLAATASLVVREDLHPDIIYLLLTKVISIHKTGGLLEKEDQFPSAQFVDFPINEKAKQYIQTGPTWFYNIFPFWVASQLDRLKILLIPLIVIMLPLLKSALPLYRWGIRSKVFRWYATLRDIDSKINTITELSLIEEEIQQVKALQKELVEQVSVPLSYMGEFYDLRMHIQLILNRLEERRLEFAPEKS